MTRPLWTFDAKNKEWVRDSEADPDEIDAFEARVLSILLRHGVVKEADLP